MLFITYSQFLMKMIKEMAQKSQNVSLGEKPVTYLELMNNKLVGPLC